MRRAVPFAALLLAAAVAGCDVRPNARVEWTTMSTIAALQAHADEVPAAARNRVQAAFAEVARRMNAYDASSEIRALASCGDDDVFARCTPSMRPCYEAAFAMARLSDGAFNPRWRGAGTLDLGAIAKGFAVDRAAAALADEPGEYLVDLGGNLKSVRGTWRVGIAGTDETIVLTNGMACATSAEYYRGKHIRDGRTGCAVSNGVVSVTVIHPTSAMLADALSTTLFILGPAAGEAFLKAHYPEATARWH